jgi:hypothetical protein
MTSTRVGQSSGRRSNEPRIVNNDRVVRMTAPYGVELYEEWALSLSSGGRAAAPVSVEPVESRFGGRQYILQEFS